jgi:hypothetical protein
MIGQGWMPRLELLCRRTGHTCLAPIEWSRLKYIIHTGTSEDADLAGAGTRKLRNRSVWFEVAFSKLEAPYIIGHWL